MSNSSRQFQRLELETTMNIERFPEDFMFELTQEKLKNWIYS